MDRNVIRSVLMGTMRIAVLWSVAFASMSVAGAPVSFSKLSWVTIHYPPAVWKDPTDGSARGIFVDTLRAVVGEEVDFGSIAVHPWPRSYHLATTQPMTVLFPVSKTAIRNKKFKFSETVVMAKIGVIVRKSVIADLKVAGKLPSSYRRGQMLKDDRALEHLAIGVVRNGVSEQLMRRITVIPKRIVPTNSIDTLMNSLQRGQIDAIAFNDYAARAKFNALAKTFKDMDPSQFEMIYLLAEMPVGFAFHPSVPDAIVDRFNASLTKAKASGAIDAILKRYLRRN